MDYSNKSLDLIEYGRAEIIRALNNLVMSQGLNDVWQKKLAHDVWITATFSTLETSHLTMISVVGRNFY